jgi:phosphoribosylformimino-5-aminoimidazole carboxamide ribotide isomerase
MLTRNQKREGFRVIPAVDLLGESAVRLEQGDFDRVVAREDDPVALVERFVRAGARLVHVVDLDGARTGRMRVELVRKLAAAAAPAPIQASGGVRSPADALALLEAGAERVVVGTAAFGEPDTLERFVAELGERLVVAVDVRGGRAVTRGWKADTRLSADDAVDRCAAARVLRLLCTAVERDGTHEGPDLTLLERVVARFEGSVLAAGGVGSRADLEAIERVGCEAAIVGRALLDGRLPLDVLSA